LFRFASSTVICLSLAACSGAERSGEPDVDRTDDRFTIRDSAGISIAENRDSAWTRPMAWSVEESPSLQIGSRNGEDSTAFGSIRDAVRFSDGRFAVSDPMNGSVVVLGDGGEFQFTVGRKGGGPEEFRSLSGLWILTGDSIAAPDAAGDKTVIFAPDGAYSRTVMGPRRGWNGHSGWETVGILPDGSFFATPFLQRWEYALGQTVTTAPMYFFDREGQDQGPVISAPFRETVNDGNTRDNVIFGAYPSFSADRAGVWLGFPIKYELWHIAPNGIDRIVRRPWTPEILSEEVKETWRGWRRSAFPENVEPFVEETLEREPMADHLPAFEEVLVSRDGYLWVQEQFPLAEQTPETWERGYPEGRSSWSVFGPNGRWLGTVLMPEALRVTEIGSDYVLGVWKDELDVSFVRLHRIVKPPNLGPNGG
jgi:hypothetical protein